MWRHCHGPTRLLVWIASVVSVWWTIRDVRSIWERFHQEIGIVRGAPSKTVLRWLWLRWQMDEDEPVFQRWLYRNRRPPWWIRRSQRLRNS